MYYNKIIKELKIEKLTYKGFGLGFHDGKAVFVQNSIPDDIVDVQINHKKGDVFFGKIHKFIERSAKRIIPSCEVFGNCGGCDWLHISYQDQIDFKQKIISDLFYKITKNEIEVQETIPSPYPEHYRNKSYLPVSVKKNIPIIGMFARRSHNVIVHNNCVIQPEIFDQLSNSFVDYLKSSKAKIYNEENNTGNIRHFGIRYSFSMNQIIIIIVTKSKKLPFTNLLIKKLTTDFPNIVGIIQNINRKPVNTILGEEDKILFGQSYFYEEIDNKTFKVNYLSFLQVNSGQAIKLYNFIISNVNSGDIVIDAYSGIGTIGIFLSDKVYKVFCVERNENSSLDAIENGKINKISNIKFITGKVEEKIPSLCKKNTIDTIIFDPPRRGLEKSIIDTVCSANIHKVIYISCDPATQVRDVKHFICNGYVIKKIQPFDMFPQTYHIENVVILERSE